MFIWIAAHPQNEWEISAAYMEIYNEQITDLLQGEPQNATNLKVAEDATFGPTVKGLTEIRVLGSSHCMSLLFEGEQRRSYGATQMIDFLKVHINRVNMSDALAKTRIIENMQKIISSFGCV